MEPHAQNGEEEHETFVEQEDEEESKRRAELFAELYLVTGDEREPDNDIDAEDLYGNDEEVVDENGNVWYSVVCLASLG